MTVKKIWEREIYTHLIPVARWRNFWSSFASWTFCLQRLEYACVLSLCPGEGRGDSQGRYRWSNTSLPDRVLLVTFLPILVLLVGISPTFAIRSRHDSFLDSAEAAVLYQSKFSCGVGDWRGRDVQQKFRLLSFRFVFFEVSRREILSPEKRHRDRDRDVAAATRWHGIRSEPVARAWVV